MGLVDHYSHIMWYYKLNIYHQFLLYKKHIGEVGDNLHLSLTIEQIEIIYKLENN